MVTPAGFTRTADLPVATSLGADDYLLVVVNKSTTPINKLIASSAAGVGTGVDVTVLDRIVVDSAGEVVTSGGNVVYTSGA